MFWRLHASAAKTFLDNGAVTPGLTGITIVATYDDEASLLLAHEQALRAEALGLDVVLGQMVMRASGGAAGWLSREHWQVRADYLESIHALRLWRHDPRVSFDFEAYTPSTQPSLAALAAWGATVDDLAAAMSPFLRVITRRRIVPFVYPVVLNDESIPLVFAASGGVGEAWSEDGFDLLTDRLTYGREGSAGSFLTAARAAIATQKRFPTVRVRQVLGDDAAKRWAQPVINEVRENIGPLEPWLFDNERRDIAHLGSQAWYEGTTLSSLNGGLAHVWNPARYAGPHFEDLYGDKILTGYIAGPGGIEPRLDERGADRRGAGYEFPAVPPYGADAYGLRADLPAVMGPGLAWTLSTGFHLPSTPPPGVGAILGASQANRQSWELRWVAGELHLLVNLPTGPVSLCLGPAPLGQPVKVKLGRGDSGHAWRYGNNASTLAANPEHLSTLLMNLGGDWQVWGWSSWPGLRWVEPLHIWGRWLTDPEYAHIDSGVYPWRTQP